MDGKFIKDVIHGYIELSSICVKIIDTPEFQRLRNLKQLGFAFFVYPTANHTRFEHSIGVSYLAGKMARLLLKPRKDIINKESWIKCAEIAGLCHDLGHGPFSHIYEKYMSPEFKHEEESIKVFEKLCGREPFRGEITEDEEKIIKAMILPEDYETFIKEKKMEKFMFQIVSNDENGIDVDKWDYLTRDNFYLGLPSAFDHTRLIAHAKAIEVNEEVHICYPLKLKEHIFAMYHSRRWNYKHAYLHRVVLCINQMFADAAKTIEVKSDDTDAIYYDLRNDGNANIERIEKRELYVTLGEIPHKKLFENMTEEQIKGNLTKEDAKNEFLEIFSGVNGMPKEEDLRVDSQVFKYGLKAKEAFKKIYFYPKLSYEEEPKALPEEEVNQMFSEVFADKIYYFFSTKRGEFTVLQQKIQSFINKKPELSGELDQTLPIQP